MPRFHLPIFMTLLVLVSVSYADNWQAAFLTGKDKRQADDSVAELKLGDSYTDPVTGLDVRRVSSAKGTRFNRIIYSRLQAENADGTYFLTYHGNAEIHVNSLLTNKRVRRLNLESSAEVQWHPTDPQLLRYTEAPNSYVGRLRLFEMNVDSGKDKVLVDLEGRLPWEGIRSRFGGSGYLTDGAEGSPSRDGNRYAWMVFNRDERPVGIVTYDLATDSVLGQMDWDRDMDIDSVSMSPSGKYVVVSGEPVVIYDADLTNPRPLPFASEHSDIGIGADGDDYYLHVDFESNDGDIVAYNMRTLEKMVLFSMYSERATTSLHISGKAYDRPGWAVISTYYGKDSEPAWTYDKVFAISFDPALDEQIVLNLAHTRNCAEGYWTEPHAVPNRDLSAVYFNSNWGSCEEDASAYRITVPNIGPIE